MTAVLHLRSGTGLYGADRALLALAGATTRFAPVVGVLGRDPAQDELGPAARARGLEALHFRSVRPFDLACASALARWVIDRRVALLHAHDFKSLAMAMLAAPRAGVPVVATFHGDTDASLKLRVYEAIGRTLGNATRGVVAVSRPLEQRLKRWIFGAPVHFIANGVEPVAPLAEGERERARRELGLAPGEVAVAAIGRLSPEKGQRVLLEALARLPHKPQLLLAGDGPDRAMLEARARGLPVRFLGYRDSMRAVYAAADVVVLPSLTEGLPMVALETGLYERPLLATRVGELPQVVPDAEALVDPGDPEALAARLAELCFDAGLRRARAERLKARVMERYTATAMARRYESLLYAPALARVAVGARQNAAA